MDIKKGKNEGFIQFLTRMKIVRSLCPPSDAIEMRCLTQSIPSLVNVLMLSSEQAPRSTKSSFRFVRNAAKLKPVF